MSLIYKHNQDGPAGTAAALGLRGNYDSPGYQAILPVVGAFDPRYGAAPGSDGAPAHGNGPALGSATITSVSTSSQAAQPVVQVDADDTQVPAQAASFSAQGLAGSPDAGYSVDDTNAGAGSNVGNPHPNSGHPGWGH